MLIAIPFAAGFWRVFHDMQPGGNPNIGLMIGLLLPLLPNYFPAGGDCDRTRHYSARLDAATHRAGGRVRGEAWSSAWARIRAEKGQFFAYALLRLILPIIASIAIFMILLIPGLVLAGAVAGVEFGIHSALANSAGSASVAVFCCRCSLGWWRLAF